MNQADGGQLRGVLGHLSKLTSIRDTELLERSLLRTLSSQLGLQDTELYRLDAQQRIIRAIYAHRSKIIDTDGEARLVERIEEILHPGDLPAPVIALSENLRLLKRPCSQPDQDRFLNGYPLLCHDEVCGYFMFNRPHPPSPVEDMVIRGILEVFSNYHTLLDASLRDRLTGLLNRQALENNFDRIWNALLQHDPLLDAGRGRPPKPSQRYWVGMIDIDHFKAINDNFGHMVGDEILLLCARLMASLLRGSDLLYRYGGEEFVAIVGADDTDEAHAIFERVRLAIEAHVFPQVGHITVSAGFTELRADLLPVDVLGQADRSLYQAKRDGRNRVHGYGALMKAGVFKEIHYSEPELF